MKNILLLFTKHSVASGESDPAALCDALAAAANGAATYEHALYDDLQHYINSDNGRICLPDGRPLEVFSAIYQRRWISMPVHAAAVAAYLRKKGVPYVDAESIHGGSVNKLAQYWRMWEHGLPFPRSVFVTPVHLSAWLAAHLTEEFTLPCVLKSVAGQRGQNNYLVHSVDEAVQVARDNPTVPFIVQEFIPNDGDYRVLVCGDTIGLVIHRASVAGTHKNNTSQGAAARIAPTDELLPAVQAASVKAAQIFGRNIAGVDVVVHKDDPQSFYFFEVNRSPQIDNSTFTAEKAAVINDYLVRLGGGTI